MVPALFAIDRAATTRNAALLCWWAGTVVHGGGFYWLVELLRRFAGLPWWLCFLLYVLLAAYQGAVFLLFGWAVRTVRERSALPMVLIAPMVMVTCELLVPFLFPSPLAISQAWQPRVIQIADVTGPPGVTALLFAVNGAIYDLLTRRGRGLRPALAGGVVFLAALAYGGVRMRQIDRQDAAAPKLSVGLVQPNIPDELTGVLHPEQAQRQLSALQQQTVELSGQGAQLVVWSEGSYPYSLSHNFDGDLSPNDSRAIRRGFTTPVMVGAVMAVPNQAVVYNSAFLLDSSGRVAGLYDKMRLLAFGEYIPGIDYFPWMRAFVPTDFGDMIPGREVRTVPFKDASGRVWRLGVEICYEDIIPDYLRQIGALHPQLLVNLTDDAWFGAKTEPWQHLALAVFGPVEQRTSLVRAVNSGVSAFIDPNGRVLKETYAVDPDVNPVPADKALDAVPLLEGGHTVYEKVGNLFAYLCLAGTVFLLAFTWNIGRKGDARPGFAPQRPTQPLANKSQRRKGSKRPKR